MFAKATWKFGDIDSTEMGRPISSRTVDFILDSTAPVGGRSGVVESSLRRFDYLDFVYCAHPLEQKMTKHSHNDWSPI